MNFKLRGVEYAITNTSDTILTKVSASVQNGMSTVEDDARVCYAICTACPNIPADIVSYESASKFKLTLDFMEIGVFMVSLNIALLQKSKVQSQKDKLAVKSKIKELNLALQNIDKGLNSEQVKLILGQVKVTDTINVDSTEVDDDDLEIEDELEDDDLEVDDEIPLTPEQEAIALRYLKQVKR